MGGQSMRAGWLFKIWLLAALGVGAQGPAQAIVLGPLKGNTVMGEPLRLSAQVSQLQADQMGQLREGCLRAKLEPQFGYSDGRGVLIESPRVRAQFVRMGAHSGEFFFDAPALLPDPSLILQLESHCPLITFAHQWAVLLSPGQAEGVAKSPGKITATDVHAPQFDFANSRLLAQSRELALADTARAASWPSRADVTRTNATSAKPLADTPLAPAMPPVAADPINQDPLPPVELASANHLVYARDGFSDAERAGELQQRSQGLSRSLTELLAWPAGVGSAFLLLGGVAYWRFISGRNQASRPACTLAVSTAMEETAQADQQGHAAQHANKPIAFRVAGGGGRYDSLEANRVLESFYTPDHPSGLDFAEVAEPLAEAFEHDDRSQRSIDKSIRLLKRAITTEWRLPDSFQALVRERNQALRLHQENALKVLQCQLGLVELAYQEAMEGRPFTSEQGAEFLVSLLGDDFASHLQADWPTLPDVVRTYVRAKFCEVTGADSRQLFKKNLQLLVDNPPAGKACFDASLWQELLSEQPC